MRLVFDSAGGVPVPADDSCNCFPCTVSVVNDTSMSNLCYCRTMAIWPSVDQCNYFRIFYCRQCRSNYPIPSRWYEIKIRFNGILFVERERNLQNFRCHFRWSNRWSFYLLRCSDIWKSPRAPSASRRIRTNNRTLWYLLLRENSESYTDRSVFQKKKSYQVMVLVFPQAKRQHSNPVHWTMLKYAALSSSMSNFVELCYAQTMVVAMAVGVAQAMALCCCCYWNAFEMVAPVSEIAIQCFLFASTALSRFPFRPWKALLWHRPQHDFDSTGTMLCAV